MGFFLRWLFAFVLLAATFNPTRWNYLRWAEANWGIETPLDVLLGLILVVAYVIYLRATFRSIGPLGMVLVAALVGALVWVLIDWGVLTLQNPSLNTWLGLFALSVILGIGLSWSIVRRRLSGQVDMDDVDED
jgi:hypothetical protein